MASRAEDDGTRATSIYVPSLASTQILIELLCFAELHARHENRLLISSSSSSSSSSSPSSTLLDHFLQGDSMAASSRPHRFSCDRSLDRLRGAGERVVGRFSGQRMDLFKLKGWPFHGVCSISLRRRSRGSCMRWDNGGASVSLNRKAMAEGGQGLAAVLLNVVNEWKQVQIMALAGILACTVWIVPSAYAADALKTCTCLLKECRVELAKCIANPSCAANVACLQTCNNRPDETECQIKCGDLFENSVVDEFNECAVSRKKCVPRKNDVGEFPVPDFSVLDKNFDIGKFSGKWYITSGLNPTFDTFDCQVHEFHMESGKLVGNLTWRIRTPDTGFFTRSALQKFVQDPSEPGILYNHDNEYLHYQDDWYILSSKIENKDNDYVFVYYRGRNDAWDGYGGAVIYTRSAVLPQSIVPELEKAAKNVGRDFSTFIRTDNTCGPEPPLVERLEKTVEEGEKTIIREVEEIEEEVEKVGKTEMTLFQRLSEGFKELVMDEQNFLKELSKEEMEVLDGLKMEAAEVDKLFGRALPIRKLR